MHYLVITLQLGPFINSFCKKLAIDLDDLHCRAAKYRQLEELIEFASESVSTRGSIKLFTRFDTKKNAYKDVIVKYVDGWKQVQRNSHGAGNDQKN
ncbi:hypothetical protein JHK82_018990 [Glycine max]|nr:hypothetical protein JHK82_018990 [Glycine max]